MNTHLEETNYEYNGIEAPQRGTGRAKSKASFILILFPIILWGGLIYGGYWFVEQRIDQKINEGQVYFESSIARLAEQNQATIAELVVKLDEVNGELINVKNELFVIQEDLALTGETLSGTDQTKVALQQRIEKLTVQLNELQTSIQRLEDAASN